MCCHRSFAGGGWSCPLHVCLDERTSWVPGVPSLRAVEEAVPAVSKVSNAAELLLSALSLPAITNFTILTYHPLFCRSDSIDKLISNLHVTDDERRRLVNTCMDPGLMSTMLDFLYRDDHVDSVPPMLQVTPPLNPAGMQPIQVFWLYIHSK